MAEAARNPVHDTSRARCTRNRDALPLEQSRGEVCVIEREPGHDHDRPSDEHQEHQRHEGPFVELHASQIDCDEEPKEGEGDAQTHRPGFEGRAQRVESGRKGEVP